MRPAPVGATEWRHVVSATPAGACALFPRRTGGLHHRLMSDVPPGQDSQRAAAPIKQRANAAANFLRLRLREFAFRHGRYRSRSSNCEIDFVAAPTHYWKRRFHFEQLWQSRAARFLRGPLLKDSSHLPPFTVVPSSVLNAGESFPSEESLSHTAPAAPQPRVETVAVTKAVLLA